MARYLILQHALFCQMRCVYLHHMTAFVPVPSPCCPLLLSSQSHDARVMSAWEAQQAEWDRQAQHLSAVAAKHPAQLALNAGKARLACRRSTWGAVVTNCRTRQGSHCWQQYQQSIQHTVLG